MAIPGKVEQIVATVTNRMTVRAWYSPMMPFMTLDCDLVHFMKNLGVFGLRQPNVVTMYDMTTLVYPQLLPKFDVLYWKTVQKWTLHHATRIIAISANTASDIWRFYAIPLDKIDIIYPAYAAHFMPATAEEMARVRQRYELNQPYILHLGRLDRKKNASQLVRAFHKMRTKTNYPGKLVFVGEEYSKGVDYALYTAIQELGLADQVQFTGLAPDADLPAILSAAQVAVMTSLHEGFGIVALEAMACGVPTVVNRAGAVYEVVGDAGIVLDGNNLEDLVHALILVTQQSDVRTWMHQRGLQQASRFGWKGPWMQRCKHIGRHAITNYEQESSRRSGGYISCCAANNMMISTRPAYCARLMNNWVLD